MKISSATITIRSHHLLCLQGFQGHGYNKDFVDNMQKLINVIFSSPKLTFLKLVSGQDDFCSSCPHHGGTVCKKDTTADTRMKSMDNATLRKLKLSEGTTAPAKELIALSNQILKTQDDAKEICGPCEWREKCLWYQKLSY